MIHSQEFPLSKRSIHTRFGCAVTLFLLSAAIEWALETCTFLSQLCEIFLNTGVTMNWWRLWRVMSGVLAVNGGSSTAQNVRSQRSKFVASPVRPWLLDLSSSYPYQPLVLISSDKYDAGLRRKRVSANVCTLSLGSAICNAFRCALWCTAAATVWTAAVRQLSPPSGERDQSQSTAHQIHWRGGDNDQPQRAQVTKPSRTAASIAPRPAHGQPTLAPIRKSETPGGRWIPLRVHWKITNVVTKLVERVKERENDGHQTFSCIILALALALASTIIVTLASMWFFYRSRKSMRGSYFVVLNECLSALALVQRIQTLSSGLNVQNYCYSARSCCCSCSYRKLLWINCSQ